MVKIRDPVHGTIELSDLEERVIDTRQMQKLRQIRQLAMAYLVYPGANHTRFEHSIGTLFLADKICKEMNIEKEETEKVRLAALLHDIGHTAFSHEGEEMLKKFTGGHEKLGEEIIMHEISDIISENFNPNEMAELYRTPLGQIITSDIGADRMDYLLRDSYYTGVAYGVIDADRICSCLSLSKNGLLLEEKGLAAAESLLVARFTMFSTVYLHKTVRIASRMLQEALFLSLQDGTLDRKSALEIGDSAMLDLLCKSPKGKEYALRLKERKLYKKAHSFPLQKVKDIGKLEEKLRKKSRCDVLVDFPKLSVETRIFLEDKRPLSEVSELVSALFKMQKSRLDILVMCDEKNVKKVSEAARKI